MTRMRPLLHVLVAIVLIATGFMTSAPHTQPADLDGPISSAVEMSTEASGEAAHGDQGAHLGSASCSCACSMALAASDGLPMRMSKLTSLVFRPTDPGHLDALLEALPRPPRTFA